MKRDCSAVRLAQSQSAWEGSLRRAATAALIALSFVVPAVAQDKELDAEAKFVGIFMGACFATRAAPEKVEAFVASQGYPLAAGPAAAFHLQGKSGKVWSAEKDVEGLVVAQREDGRCGVYARRLSGERVHFVLGLLMTMLGLQSGRQAELAFDRKEQGQMGEVRSVSWLFPLPEGKKIPILAVTPTDPGSDLQAAITTSMVRD